MQCDDSSSNNSSSTASTGSGVYLAAERAVKRAPTTKSKKKTYARNNRFGEIDAVEIAKLVAAMINGRNGVGASRNDRHRQWVSAKTSEGRCFKCDQKGHIARNCPNKAVNKTKPSTRYNDASLDIPGRHLLDSEHLATRLAYTRKLLEKCVVLNCNDENPEWPHSSDEITLPVEGRCSWLTKF